MATRQGIALGPIAQTQRSTTSIGISTGYATPIPGGSNYQNDSAGLAVNIARYTVIYGYQHLALKRMYELAASHFHFVNDYYQIPTYGGAYGNLGYNDSNGGAGDRTTYYETRSTDYPRYGSVGSFKGIPIVTYVALTYPLSLPISNFGRGLRIYASDYAVLRVGVIEMGTHSHLYNERTSR
jgi:hypothetical protein